MNHAKKKKEYILYRGRESKLPPDNIGRLDMMVAEVREVLKHPRYHHTYLVATVNIGELFSMLIESSLGSDFTPEELIGRKVVLCNNVKPLWVKTVDAHALIMVAHTGDFPNNVDLLIPPEDASPGDIVHCEGYPRDPDRPFMNPNKDVFENIMSFIKIDDDLSLYYKNVPLTVQGKPESRIRTAGLRTSCYIDAL